MRAGQMERAIQYSTVRRIILFRQGFASLCRDKAIHSRAVLWGHWPPTRLLRIH
jgi:hypothetical protein